ncbi:pentapeptide repeat-containing protein [Actinomadura graeca]|uniref:Pentapeptide repeat-containing protein n=2 Tax=Actinomadura graeca TaxID=2750812 RepID=A0ABX8R5D2_9ACTN|nr:pentapeptide repeat-containing protein [Actinomadura graeca]
MQSVTGLVVIVGVAFTAAGLIYTARTLDISRQAQVTDRYTKAIEQLGSGRPEVRMGGIYALERLMADSSRDRPTIIEVLAAYIRSHAQDRPPAGSDRTRLAVDVESALTVLGRAQLHLGTVDLRDADLHGKNLSGVKLSIAKLSGANLTGADVTHADLAHADLTGAKLSGADLRGAYLSGAKLFGADLTHTDLRGADLRASMGAPTPKQLRMVARTDASTRF